MLIMNREKLENVLKICDVRKNELLKDVEMIDSQIEFTKQQLEQLKPKHGWDRSKFDKYYSLTVRDGVFTTHLDSDIDLLINEDYFNNNNYNTDKATMEHISHTFNLHLKLRKFSEMNGGLDIDWSNMKQDKYCIMNRNKDNEICVEFCRVYQDMFTVYFISREIAQKAIDLYKEDLLKYYEFYRRNNNE